MIPLFLSLAIAATAGGDTATWTGFRNGGSSIAATDNLPTTWSPESGIAWQAELPGYGQSSPVAWRGLAVVTSVEGPMKERCVVTALDIKTGEIRWSRSIEASVQGASNFRVSRAAPTPVIDGRAAYAFFESGDLVAVSHEGQLKWHRSLARDYGSPENHHGLGSSPAQTEELVILDVEHEGPSYLVAIDKATGQTRWKVDRPSGMSWTSPIVVDSVEPVQVIVSSNGAVSGYDAAGGEQLWLLDGVSGNAIPSPTAAGSRVFVGAAVPEFGTEAVAAQSNACLQLGVGEPGYEICWRAEKALCDYASPVVHRGCVYYVNKVGAVFCLDDTTGRSHYARRIAGPCWATPIAAGDHVFFFAKDGTTTVLQAGPDFREVAVNQLWDPKSPPKPSQYVEHSVEPTVERSPGQERSGGMAERLLAGDADGSGTLTPEELSPRMRGIFANVDGNGDGVLDGDEIRKMGEDFRKRRTGSREANRDPIVYGVAAVDGAILVRTGTRLFCVRRAAEASLSSSPSVQ